MEPMVVVVSRRSDVIQIATMLREKGFDPIRFEINHFLPARKFLMIPESDFAEWDQQMTDAIAALNEATGRKGDHGEEANEGEGCGD